MNLYAHVYANVGNSVSLGAVPFSTSLRELMRGVRSAVGFGVVLPISEAGRLEVNYSVPIVSRPMAKPPGRFSITLSAELL